MKIQRDLQNSYVRFEGFDLSNLSKFQLRMLSENNISNLLKFSFKVFDNKIDYLFDTTQKVSIKEYVEQENIVYSFIFQFLQSLLMAVVSIDEFLLDESCILLNEDCIFVDPNKESFYFCYIPYVKNDLKESLKSLIGYFQENINADDKKCESIIKELNNDVIRDRFFVGNVLERAVNKYYRSNKELQQIEKFKIEENSFYEQEITESDSDNTHFLDRLLIKFNLLLDKILNR